MKIKFSQKAIIYNKKQEFLIIRRSETAKVDPKKWDLPGGYLKTGEDIQDSIIREIKEETGLNVYGLRPFNVRSNIEDKEDTTVVTISYKAHTRADFVKLSFEHDQFRWITVREIMNFDLIPKLKSVI